MKPKRVGRIPVGSKLDSTGERVPDVREAATVTLIHEMRRNQFTYREIADALNKRGLPSRTGAKWSAKVVWSIVQRATNIKRPRSKRR